MKQLIAILLVLFVLDARAQNFEGTIKWSMKMDMTDPVQKAKMEEAQKKMNDPATRKKMEEMKARMNDPQMKAMMDSNPQMKAAMEKMMNGGDMSSMMPKGFIIKMKGQNVLTTMDGGPMAMETLYLKDKDVSYSLNRAEKTYSALPSGKGSSQSSGTPPKVTKTGETTKILNYTCVKYIVEVQEGGRSIKQSVWTTTDIKDIDFKALARQRVGRGQSIYYEGMEGIPLRIEVTMPEANMTMEVTEIKKESLNASDFSLPADFRETQGMFGR